MENEDKTTWYDVMEQENEFEYEFESESEEMTLLEKIDRLLIPRWWNPLFWLSLPLSLIWGMFYGISLAFRLWLDELAQIKW